MPHSASVTSRNKSTIRVYDAFGQREVTQYFHSAQLVFVILEVPPQLAGDWIRCANFYVRSSTVRPVPLSVLVRTDTRPVAPLASTSKPVPVGERSRSTSRPARPWATR